MKKLLFISALLLSSATFSQKFTSERVAMNGTEVKLKTIILVKDSIITFITNDIPADFKVKQTAKNGNFSTYKGIFPEDSDFEMRISLNKDGLKKKLPWTLVIEQKDNFSGTLTNTVYYMKKEDE